MSVNEWTEQLADGAERLCKFGLRDRNHVAYATWRVWFVGLSHFQHSAAHFLLKCTGIFDFPYIQSLAKAAIFVYSAKTTNSTTEVKSKWDYTNNIRHKTSISRNIQGKSCGSIGKDYIKVDYENHGVCVGSSWLRIKSNVWPLKRIQIIAFEKFRECCDRHF